MGLATAFRVEATIGPPWICTHIEGAGELLCYDAAMLIAISVPANNERGPQYMEQVFDAIHSFHFLRSRVSFEFGRHADTVMLYCRFPAKYRSRIVDQLRASYPDARITTLPDDALAVPAGWRQYRRWLKVRDDRYALRTWPEFRDQDHRNVADPVAGILNTLATDRVHSHIRITARRYRSGVSTGVSDASLP